MVNMVSCWRKFKIDWFHLLQDNKFAEETKAKSACLKDLAGKPPNHHVSGQPVAETASSPGFTLIKVLINSS